MFIRLFSVTLAILLVGCSEPPKRQQAKEPEKSPEPVTGRRAFYYIYPAARIWAPDCLVLQVRDVNLSDVKSEKGKAGAWQVTFVSPSRARQRSWTYSVVEEAGNLHKGVFAGLEESYSGRSGQTQPFLVAAFRIDSDAALETAVKQSKAYVAKHPDMPVTFLLEKTPRFPDPAWRVIWGESVGTSDYSVFVDASTGAFLAKAH
ncbi:MAG TPA: hypothetical protein VKV15_18120 [Bryobacteraceae bacterium]|nr:hypothetical protein [Bryobacteraceae bacterium]